MRILRITSSDLTEKKQCGIVDEWLPTRGDCKGRFDVHCTCNMYMSVNVSSEVPNTKKLMKAQGRAVGYY